MKKVFGHFVTSLIIIGGLLPVNAASNIRLDAELRNLVDRTNFAASLDDIKLAKSLGYDAYLAKQLNPDAIDDSEFEDKYLNTSGDRYINPLKISEDYYSLERWTFNHMAYSKKQLLEVMTQFWDNHFNTDLNKDIEFWDVDRAELEPFQDGSVSLAPQRNRFSIYSYPAEEMGVNLNLADYDRIELALKAKNGIGKKMKIRFYSLDKDNDDEELFYSTKVKIKSSKSFDTFTVPIDEAASGLIGIIELSFKSSRLKKEALNFKSLRLISDTDPSKTISLSIDLLNAEYQENKYFREHALGNFADLLKYNAKSPSMLVYLDNWLSFKGNPNENYARELMELHTMGADAGYTQEDVEAAAKLFTGWTVRDNKFYFDSSQHDTSDLDFSFLSSAITDDTDAAGDQFLEALAIHGKTAEFVCQKLITLFVDDTTRSRSDTLVSSCASSFIANKDADDQIAKILQTILSSSEFKSSSTAKAKIYNPMEVAVDKVRKFNLDLDAEFFDILHSYTYNENYLLYQMPVPTGYKEVGSKWLGASQQLLSRIQLAENLAYEDQVRKNYEQILRDNTDGSASQIVDFTLDYFIGNIADDTDKEILLDQLGESFTLDSGSNYLISELLLYALNLPKAQLH